MLIRLSTDKTVSEASAAVHANHFGVMQVHNLKETMAKKGVEFPHECLIFEVCQPQQAKKVLDENMSVSTALPCRISIYEEDGKTMLATLKPTTLLATFNTPQLESVAQEVEATIVRIIEDRKKQTQPEPSSAKLAQVSRRAGSSGETQGEGIDRRPARAVSDRGSSWRGDTVRTASERRDGR